MSTSESCVSEVTTVISQLRTSSQEIDVQNGEIAAEAKSEDSSNPSPTQSPSPIHAIRLGNLGDQMNSSMYKCPIIGHEVMEERARFTVYKLRVENQTTGECWFVFRRYTDFVRLYTKLKCEFPSLNLALPRKRWFGDNFNPSFIEERMRGLQKFLDSLLKNGSLQLSLTVREFFCLDEPPSAVDSIDESRAIFEALEDALQQLRTQLVDRELSLEKARTALVQQTLENERLMSLIRDCPRCSKEPPHEQDS